MDTWSRLNVCKAFIWRPERLLNVLRKFSLGCLSIEMYLNRSNKLISTSSCGRGETHGFAYAMHHSDVNNMPPSPTPYYMRYFQIFDKIDSFLKHVFDSKKDYIFEETLNLHVIGD